MCQLSSASTPGLHTNPAISTNAIPGHTGLQSLLHTSLHHFRTLHLNQGRRMTLAPPPSNAFESCGEESTYFNLYWNISMSSWIFSKKADVKLPRGFQNLVGWVLCWSALQAFSFPVHSKSVPPPFDSGLNLDPRLCSSLLRHCKLIMFRKYRIGRNAVKLGI
jgi:hypothetical protein